MWNRCAWSGSGTAPRFQAVHAVRLGSMSILAVSARFDVPLDWGSMAPFQRAVYRGDGGGTFRPRRDFAGIARKIGKPGATRAVGNALGEALIRCAGG